METKEQVVEVIREYGLAHLLDKLEPLIWPSIRITYPPEQPANFVLGASRLGGLPDLPPHLEWPQWRGYRPPRSSFREPAGPLCFLAQINMSDVAPYDTEQLLPSTGIFYFFAATWVNCITATGIPNENELWRVFYYSGPLTKLQRIAVPTVSEELRADTNYNDYAPENHQFKPCAIVFSREMTLPSRNHRSPYWRGLNFSEDDNRRYNEVVDHVSPSSLPEAIPNQTDHTVRYRYAPIHRMLGHTQINQVYPKDSEALLLFQLDSDLKGWEPSNPSNIYWEFGGRAVFFIHPAALKAGDFTQVELVYEAD